MCYLEEAVKKAKKSSLFNTISKSRKEAREPMKSSARSIKCRTMWTGDNEQKEKAWADLDLKGQGRRSE